MLISTQGVTLALVGIVSLLETLLDPEAPLFLKIFIWTAWGVWLFRPYSKMPTRTMDLPLRFRNLANEKWSKAMKQVPKTGDRYLIIGVGFLGENLVHKLLLRGETNIVLFDMSPKVANLWKGDKRVRFFQGNVLKKQDLLKAMEQGIDTVFCHFAIIKWFENLPHQKDFSMKINVDGTKCVIEACLEAGVKRIIQTSSSSVCQAMYRDSLTDMDENTPYVTEHDSPHWYALSKAIAEKLILEADGKVCKNGKKLHTGSARACSSIVGAKDFWVAQYIMENTFSFIPPNGGNQLIDLNYVDNVVYGHLLVERGLQEDDPNVQGNVFCISPSHPVRLCDFFQTLVEAKKKMLNKTTYLVNPPYHVSVFAAYMVDVYHSIQQSHKLSGQLEMLTRAALFHLDQDYNYSHAKAKRILGYEPLFSVEETVEQIAVEYKDRKMYPLLS